MADNFMKLYGAQDINEKELIKDLTEEASGNRALYLTATANLRELRREQGVADSNNLELYSFQKFKEDIIDRYVRKNDENIIKNVEQRLILEQIIVEEYQGDIAKLDTFTSIVNDLFDLFNFILFHNHEVVEKEILQKIKDEYSVIELSIFQLFNRFSTVLNEKMLASNKITYQEAIKLGIRRFINEQGFKKVFLDGFLFFDDLQRYLVGQVIEAREEGSIKNLIFVSKYDTRSTDSMFLAQNIEELKEEYDIGEESIDYSLDYNSKYQGVKALVHLKRNYLNIDHRRKDDYEYNFDQENLRIRSPFISRGQEFEFVAKQISELLKNSDNAEALLERSNEDIEGEESQGGICVIIARDREKYESKLARFFKEYGLFKFPEEKIEEIVKEFELDNDILELQNKKYFSRKEFLNDEDIDLPIASKYKLFKELKGIEVNLSKRPIASYPIGQFIFKIYDIIKDGLNIDDFKVILNSNWISKECSEYIKDFQAIEVFFERLEDEEVEKWITQIDYLLEIYGQVRDDELYRWHPLRSVEIDALSFLREVLGYIQSLINKLDSDSASFKEHIGLMRENLVNYDEHLQDLIRETNYEEDEVVMKIFEIISDMDYDSTVDGVSTIQFADHIRGMIKDWQRDRDSEEPDIGEVAIVNLENMRHYKHTFFVALESDKYPRYYDEKFPFSPEIIKILKDDLNITPVNHRGIKEHFKLEKYLFKNVIDFTDEQLDMTYVKREGSDEKLPSIYLEDLASMFGKEIDDLEYELDEDNKDKLEESEESIIEIASEEEEEVSISKDEYTTLELAIFDKLCPKMYYHLFANPEAELLSFKNRFQLRFYVEAILYNKAVNKLVEYSEINNKSYSIHDDEVYFVFKGIVDKYKDDVFHKFNFLTNFEEKDIRLNILKKFSQYLEHLLNSIEGIREISYRFNNFTFKKANGDFIELDNGVRVRSKIDFKVVSIDNRSYPLQFANYYYLYFLVLRTDRDEDQDLIKQLMYNLKWWDQHLYKKEKREERKEKVAEIVDEIERNSATEIEANNSEFCKYCLISDICKEDHLFKEDSDGAH
ncbi:hypothetical protein [Selenihalanaerobacter shriftii]|uniref:PD-(D/E)XK endonuclease-like domain-containing protein n=1 Tax=Selenihalanaerobacter shriftii TaxID=142842 RepID=A0A1T4NFY5_9FIRM|nr:hypothetical protein [Selenihalanaerobacter shriftii]SJZ77907.1 hypothetical protein SAMN02745118_01793 [Selenihalanaerobacter shriftii]